jgi:hypothetical protein
MYKLTNLLFNLLWLDNCIRFNLYSGGKHFWIFHDYRFSAYEILLCDRMTSQVNIYDSANNKTSAKLCPFILLIAVDTETETTPKRRKLPTEILNSWNFLMFSSWSLSFWSEQKLIMSNLDRLDDENKSKIHICKSLLNIIIAKTSLVVSEIQQKKFKWKSFYLDSKTLKLAMLFWRFSEESSLHHATILWSNLNLHNVISSCTN